MKTDWFRGSYLSVSSRRRMASTIGRSPEQHRRSPPLASSAQDRDRAFHAKRRWEDKLSRAKGLFPCLQCPGPGPRLPSEATAGRQTVSRQGIVSAPACAFCWNRLRIPATWWWARMRIGAGFRIRSGRAAGNSLIPSTPRAHPCSPFPPPTSRSGPPAPGPPISGTDPPARGTRGAHPRRRLSL